ncbi:glycosyltransferase family 2 protein [Paenibacillus sp. J5C_2022]|uniref:glycosyltransferase family 2 protein n=1 Tax=Paenibacillus sp. J5C2022 TaxID=2977129 RepID=UPI0021D23F1E|nr:glycosyltransferase family 2 protein [Paenibacillus sp. J5C2022]MCU6710303.1 glycosyltransferase family 2 protein [Paenibacillus sp. J5C2022]
MRRITVFTPTYNRAYCLHQLYESLKRQSCDQFQWLIVDDGSTDHTSELVSGWMEEGKVQIRYIRQENQGMHGAHNTAYSHIDTELNVCIDSDDYMPDDAIEKILDYWSRHGSDKYSGIAALDAHPDGEVIGTSFPESLKSSSLFHLYQRHGVRGDKKLVYRTALTKEHPYPLFPEERYVGLDYKYYKLDERYELLLMNEVLCHVDYLPDGSSRNMLMQYVRNPQGFAFYRKAMMKLPLGGFAFKLRHAVHYVSSSLMMSNRRWLRESPRKRITLLAMVPGLLLYMYIRFKTKGASAARGMNNDYSVG